MSTTSSPRRFFTGVFFCSFFSNSYCHMKENSVQIVMYKVQLVMYHRGIIIETRDQISFHASSLLEL